ncbi:16938_t:CDS:2 [Funneliformis geosporum]|nr:16938_t:CDS:2 [Funneliformis geosporum]
MSYDSTNISCQTSTPSTLRQFVRFIDTITIPTNVKSQHIAAEKINSAAKSLAEYQRMIEIATDNSMKFISDHKRSIHSRHHNKKLKSSQEQANKTEMGCMLIPFNLNFNVAEDIVQSKGMGQLERDSHKVQSDKD